MSLVRIVDTELIPIKYMDQFQKSIGCYYRNTKPTNSTLVEYFVFYYIIVFWIVYEEHFDVANIITYYTIYIKCNIHFMWNQKM